jgi:oligosaccharide repeat unit polymerase
MKQQPADISWLHPAFVFAAAGVVIGICAYAIPESMYRTYWRTPKFFDAEALQVTLLCVVVFTLGSFCGTRLIRRKRRIEWGDESSGPPSSLTSTLFQASFYLCVLGYVLWIVLAIHRGISLSTIIGVLTGEKGAMYEARYTYLPTVGGVTTLTQFGSAMMVLAANIAFRRGWRAVRTKVAIVLLFALLRVVINSERFALIELVVPFLIASFTLRYIGSIGTSRRVRMLVALAPLIGIVALFFLFTGFEYFRSWTNYYAGRELGLWEFGAMRLLGYYVTSFNNGAYFLQRLEPLAAPYFSLHFLWGFPLSGSWIKRMFPNPLLDSSEKWFYFPFLESEANAEFNNADGMLFPMMDYGIAGGLIYWLIIGLICGVVYELFRRKETLGVFLYPMIFLGLLEVPLALYWGEGRAFPSLCFLTGAPLISWFIRRQYGWLIQPVPKRDGTVQAS